jgi:hypothetical protein
MKRKTTPHDTAHEGLQPKPKKPNVSKDSDSPGFCSSPGRGLSREQIDGFTQTQDLTEKALVGKGNRQMFKVEDHGNFLVEFAGARKAKFISKDADRFEAMAAAARALPANRETVYTLVVLLAADGTICRRNTLPRLIANGVVVQRCECE